jgi:biopolymer transport protein ExbD
MKLRKPKVDPIEVNLTPMIDCMLFLLVFLLLATTYNQYSRLKLVLPEATGVPPEKLKRKVEVVVKPSGEYLVNGLSLSANNEAELITAIKQAAGTDRSMPFTIAADGKATHQAVVQVMDVAGKLGFVNLNISTRVPHRGQS